MNNICIISQAPLSYSETFIQAHIDRMAGKIFHLHGYFLDYSENGLPLRDKHLDALSIKDRLINVLPYYFAFRIKHRKRRTKTDFCLVERYLLEKNIDVVLAEYGTTGSFITPVCKKLNIPLIVHFHGYDASRISILNEFHDQYKFMFEYASYVVSVSHFMSQSLIKMGCPKEKIVYNPYGPNPMFFDVSPEYNSNTIIAVGRFTYKKAPYHTLAAFKEVLKHNPELHLVFVGDGELLEVCQNLANSWHIDSNVEFLGSVTQSEIVKIAEKSFLFAQHSLVAKDGDSEGTPVSIIEAGAAGLPVVATKHGGIPDVVIHQETGLIVDEGDSKGMAKALLKLEEDRVLTKQLGQNAKRRIKKYFSLEKHISTLDYLVSQLNHK